MNILFLVMNFLLIFLFLQAAILKNSGSFSSIKKSTCSYFASKIGLQSKWEQYKYQTYLKEKITSSSKTIKHLPSQPKTSFKSHRFKDNIPSIAKWNLSSLFSSDFQTTLLTKELTQNLVTQLYSHAFFWKEAEKEIPNLSEVLIQSFLDMKGSSPKSLIDLFPQDLVLQKVYYKMLQGSGSYDLFQKKGYPPLEEFFTFLPKEKSITNFSHASYFILKAIFKDPIIESILTQEKEKWKKDYYLHCLTKEELRSLCLNNPLTVPGKRFQDIEPMLQFSHKKAKLEKLKSPNKEIQISLKIPEKS